jgi:hypothetical protein
MLGYGAPFQHDWFGFSLELGGGAVVGPEELSEDDNSRTIAQATAYARGAFVCQFPVTADVRPLLSTSAFALTNELGGAAAGMTLEVGLAWQAL